MTRSSRFLLSLLASFTLASGAAQAADVLVFHADSLAGPMAQLKKAFEAKRREQQPWVFN